ncbi:MAG: transglycosylase SLT domain-containing protein [Deltaproteobacteria bacterium]
MSVKLQGNDTWFIQAMILAYAVLIAFTTPANGDIYRYEDNDGIIHFTDAPTDKRYKIFLRDLKKDRLLRARLQFSKAVNPEEYENIIRASAEKYGVSKSLIKAVIHAESGYDPNAISVKGASGLMQLMPDTARSLKVSNSFDPKDNVEGGVKYLRFLLDTFRGDVSLALAAYNAGLNKVARFGGIPPYPETRLYVNRVMSYMQSYQGN